MTNPEIELFVYLVKILFFSGSIEREGIFPHLCLYSIESLRVQSESKYLLYLDFNETNHHVRAKIVEKLE